MKGISCALAAVSLCLAADNSIWKVAPPPPASWQRDRVSDLTARRKAVAERIGERAVLILYAAEPRNYANDIDWPFRQENNFFYLTGLTQPGTALVLVPGAGKMKEILFLPRPVPSRETWTGHMLTAAEAREISGIADVLDANQLNSLISTLIPRARGALAASGDPAGGRGGRGGNTESPWGEEFSKITGLANSGDLQLYMLLPARPNAAEYSREQEFAGRVAGVGAGIAIRDATAIFGELRRIKSQRELDILQHAVDITAEGFQRAYALAVPGAWEYEIQAQFEYTFLRRDSHWGYPCIVGSGVNATTLHYETNKSQLKDGELILMDDAAEFDQYSVDVTRTIPINGKFTREQAAIYRLVYDAQQAGFQNAKPGKASNAMQNAANDVFKQGLYKLGLITDPNSDAQAKVWSIHGMSHGIGLNVHDPGGRELQPGMVVTMEPGLYFRPDALDNLPKTPEMQKFAEAVRPVFEKYKGIGVRIEDDVLITTGEPRVLSAGIPSKLEDVEAAIAKLRQAARTSPPM
ncbi:MAG TPA: Xaa-Pro aminopeptidase [Candidatus Acidoferrales bacterium]|nr:Xaa-Pro aminopeptidase [Candidatus Acidoferrales bacterium]